MKKKKQPVKVDMELRGQVLDIVDQLYKSMYAPLSPVFSGSLRVQGGDDK